MSARFSFYYFCSAYFYLLVVLSLFRLCFSNKNFDDVLCIEGEREALVEFKNGLVDEANRLASWDVGEDRDCCRWNGITCDNSTGHIRRIYLPALDGDCELFDYNSRKEYEEAFKQRLRGKLSSSLLHLKQLKHLDLSCNDFGGIRVPKFIGSLTNLRYLNLSNSNFVGMIPPQLGNLSELHVLCLGSFYSRLEQTSLMNMEWLSGLHFLQHLDLSGVNLSKAIDWLQVINTIPSLLQLHLSYCELSDIHPHFARANLTSLSVLDLSYNYFSSSFPQWIFSLTSMVSLDLTRCSFYGLIHGSIYTFRNLTSLESLNVRGNTFMNSSLVLRDLSSVASNLISLDISYCEISSSALDSLHNFTSVLRLVLSGNKLTKTMPKSLGNLCNLRHLDLSDNDFSKSSLTSLLENVFNSKSPHLESLDLSENQISGTIPNFIGRLSFLRLLDLSTNKIFGLIPPSIGQLSSLNTLDLSDNQLNGNIPNSLGQLYNLEKLIFSSNLLTGVVTKTHFSKLVKLKHLYGGGNKLTPHFANWIPPFQLVGLNLNCWVLGPRFTWWLQSQKDLLYLDISNTRISSSMPPESFWRLFPNLSYLDMSKNHIQGTLRLLDMPVALFVLDLSSNKLTGELTTSNFSDLTYLDLSNNFFVGSLHNLLCSNGTNEISDLYLGNNYFSGSIPVCWEHIPLLYILNLENNNLTGLIPTTLGLSSELDSLNMRGNKLSGRIPVSLMNLTNLVILQLGRNELVGSIPSWFGTKLSRLRLLNLRSNHFDGNIPHNLCYLKHIQILDLAHNNLSGNIPRCFNNFSVLTGKETISNNVIQFMGIGSEMSTKDNMGSDSLVMKGREDNYSTILGLVTLLDLSSNNLVGHIPSELTSLKALQSLNLSRNQLIERIPKKIGDMKALISFDLSMNMLTGELPPSLSSLNFLSSFNVSYNNLTGRIPSGTQLQTLDGSSFYGNKLCGSPLMESCAVEVEVPDAKDDKEDDGPEWCLIVSSVLGFISGFWIIVAPLIVSKSWRIEYFGFLSKLRYMVYDCMHKYGFNIFSK